MCKRWQVVTNIPKVVANKVRVCSGLMTEFYKHSLAPATKLGQGNVFTGVCDSVNGGLSAPGGKGRGLFRGGCLLPAGFLLLGGWRPPGRQLLRAVRILLEYILVIWMQAIQTPNRKE